MISGIASILGAVIRVIYDLVNNNYFISIILFTVLTKLILLPLYLMQIKSTENMNKVAPLDKKIREKYKNNKEKQAEELTKLYSEYKINPMGGCLPILIQFPLIIAMFMIVRQPLTYVAKLPQDQIIEYTKEVFQKDKLDNKEAQNSEIIVAKEKNIINMEVFKGFNLGDVPSNVFSKDPNKKASPLALSIPILTLILAIVSNKIMQAGSNMTDEQKEMQKSMNLMMPLLSCSITYTMPLSLGVYWLIGSLLQIIQQIVINKIVKKDAEKERLALNKGGK